MVEVLRELDEKVDPRHAALIVVDVQNDFCADEGFFGRTNQDLTMIQACVPRLEQLINEARRAGVMVVFIRSIYDDPYLSEPMRERNLRRGLLSQRCLSGSWGADFYRVNPLPGEVVITKHRYSAFHGTELDDVLRSAGIRTAIMTGVTSNVCVESTSRDAYFRNYYVVFVDDCVATTNEDFSGATSEEIHRWTAINIQLTFGVVVKADEVAGAWAALPARGRAS
ncbi:MAG: cysteine hydrolase [Chloroflexi bacterium]|nr:cysteine hydrolase [Chloroflexota bacterium]